MDEYLHGDSFEINQLLANLRISAMRRGLQESDADEVVAVTYYYALTRSRIKEMDVRSPPRLMSKMTSWSVLDFRRKIRPIQPLTSVNEDQLVAKRSDSNERLDEEQRLELRRAMTELPFPEREAVWLMVGKGYPARKIANKRGVGERAVSARKDRGLAKLRRIYGVSDP